MGSRSGRASVKQKERRKPGRPTARPDRNSLNLETWLAFLADHVHVETDGKRYINGVQFSETNCRALHRWQIENSRPSVWTADRFLTDFYMMLEDYFDWAELAKLKPWAMGPPDWWDAD